MSWKAGLVLFEEEVHVTCTDRNVHLAPTNYCCWERAYHQVNVKRDILFSSLIAGGASLPISRVVSRDLPISSRFTPRSFYRDAGSALLHLYELQCPLSVQTSPLLNIEILSGLECTHCLYEDLLVETDK